jgi:hypothetical protein
MGQIKTAGLRLAVEATGDQPLAVEGRKQTAGHRLAVESTIGDQPLDVEGRKQTAGHRLAVEPIGDQPLATDELQRAPSGSSGSEYSIAAQLGPPDSPTPRSGSSALDFEDNWLGAPGAEDRRETFLNAEAVRTAGLDPLSRPPGAPAPIAGPDSGPAWELASRMLAAQAATQAANFERLRKTMEATQAADLERMRQTMAATISGMAAEFELAQQQSASKIAALHAEQDQGRAEADQSTVRSSADDWASAKGRESPTPPPPPATLKALALGRREAQCAADHTLARTAAWAAETAAADRAAAADRTLAAPGVPVADEGGFGLGSVDCAPADTLAEARAQMVGLTLPADWVFLLHGAPLGKKQEGKRTVADVGGALVVRDKAAKKAQRAAAVTAQAAAEAARAAAAVDAQLASAAAQAQAVTRAAADSARVAAAAVARAASEAAAAAAASLAAAEVEAQATAAAVEGYATGVWGDESAALAASDAAVRAVAAASVSNAASAAAAAEAQAAAEAEATTARAVGAVDAQVTAAAAQEQADARASAEASARAAAADAQADAKLAAAQAEAEASSTPPVLQPPLKRGPPRLRLRVPALQPLWTRKPHSALPPRPSQPLRRSRAGALGWARPQARTSSWA